MSKPTTEEIRNKFINYFVANNHQYVSGSSLIPHNDPSLMFVNSGMVQFKNVFTGQENRDYSRAVTNQKSVRAGGKHNDLDNVGYTARHHTFFEMLGNFSFGDYFKEQAIYYAWELITKEFCLPKERLYVTVYHNDDEAISYWQKIANLTNDRIIKIDNNDNFWSMGDTGPCGPCSEIFYDHGAHIPGGLPGSPDADGDRFVEIWNMVFMQFEQLDANTRIDLPKKSIDTGMGLERMVAAMQGVSNNYDIDLFQDLIHYAEEIFKVKYEGEKKFSYRIIADHLRSSAFLIADGVMPSNEGRGYVLRRIMRRAMRHAHQIGSKEPSIYKLLPKLIDLMGSSYPELKRAQYLTSDVLKQEEIRFKTTLERGLRLLDDETVNINRGGILAGDIAFKLYDTYGFPLDLTEDILKQKDIQVDLKSFSQHMQDQKVRARKSWSGSGEGKADNIWFDIKSEHGSTEFLGYSLDSLDGKVLALIKDNILLDKVDNIGENFILISNQTPFYGESGGQMGDTGIIESSSTNLKIKVIDTAKYLGSLHAHKCILEQGIINAGDNVTLTIDAKHRRNLKAHHSATHILHAVLREVLGKHVTQKGSLVAYNRLRFDISHPKALSKEEIRLIENQVNIIIVNNSEVNTIVMSADEAIEAGAMALFGEKYDSEVRVVSIGNQIEDTSSYSFELCGGTHVHQTGDIGSFKIVSESAIAAGVRRIDAVCGEFALQYSQENESLLNDLVDILKSAKDEISSKLDILLSDKKALEKEIFDLKIAQVAIIGQQLITQKKMSDHNKDKLIYHLFPNMDAKILRTAAENLAAKEGNLVVVYVSNISGKLSVTVAVSKDLIPSFSAIELAKKISIFLGGNGGGGQASLAQAGGIEVGRLPMLQDEIYKYLSIS